MSGSSKVIQDQSGYFHHPNGYPLVVIFDSKRAEAKDPNELSWQEPVIGSNPNVQNEGKMVL
jgi:hypothetical protein